MREIALYNRIVGIARYSRKELLAGYAANSGGIGSTQLPLRNSKLLLRYVILIYDHPGVNSRKEERACTSLKLETVH